MTTGDLFDDQAPAAAASPPRARRRDPRTSHAAAAQVQEFAGGHYLTILWRLRLHGPQTVSEIAAGTGMAEQQINKRLPEMAVAGSVSVATVAGRPLTRRGASGRLQRVWQAAPRQKTQRVSD
jgi:hypothetical protein